MALAISRYANILVIYDRRIESDNRYLNRLQDNDIEYADGSELKNIIAGQNNSQPLLFHCQGFAHLRLASKLYRPIDRIIMSVHCFRQNLWYGKIFALLTYYRFCRVVDMWHFLCKKIREEYFYFRSIPDNTCIIPLGVEDMFMTIAEKPCTVKNLDGGEITDLTNRVNIVYIARFQPWKRHPFLLQSLRAILKGNTCLVLVGEGPLLSKVMSLAGDLGIRDNVIFTGRVDRKTVRRILSHANLSVTVSPSETFGWCLLEPFCMDVPIVSTNVGIANSIINDFHNGFIVDVNCEEEEFCNKAEYALEHLQDIDNSSMKNLYNWQTVSAAMKQCYDYTQYMH